MFRLYPDRVEVTARWTFGKTVDTVVKLKDLSGQMETFTVKHLRFPKAVALGSFAVAFALALSRPGYPEFLRRGALLGWPVAAAAFVVAILSLPRRRFIHFPRTDGRPGLDICKAGPDQTRFEAFVKDVARQIR